MTETDRQLLERYARDRSEEAFAEIVRRHLNLVYSAALRQVRQPQLAEEISQSVFLDLARQAAKLQPDTILSAWLYQVTRRTSVDLIRRESRRQAREQVAHELNAMNAPDTDWSTIEPLLEQAMDTLEEKERAAVLLRFFERKSLSDVGAALGVNEEAARKRVSRSVDRLREYFVSRGVPVSGVGLTATISANAIQAAPAALTPAVISAASISATYSAASATAAAKLIAMTTIQKTLLATTLIAATTCVYQMSEASRARNQLRAAQQQESSLTSQIEDLTHQRDELSGQLASTKENNPAGPNNELLRLRNEVGQLRTQLAAASRPRQEAPAPARRDDDAITPEEESKRMAIAKMNYERQWLMAFIMFADKNDGQFPTNFAQAEPFLSPEAKVEHDLKPGEFPPGGMKFGLLPENYEVMFQGSLEDLTNPSGQIVLREKTPRQLEDGSYVRAYGFADGHAEIHKSAKEHKPGEIGFEAWEAQHGLVSVQLQ
jgi:RNA polymerase sigma factor (sigma-70 family)